VRTREAYNLQSRCEHYEGNLYADRFVTRKVLESHDLRVTAFLFLQMVTQATGVVSVVVFKVCSVKATGFVGSDCLLALLTGVAVDSAGNVYGTAANGGLYGHGTIFKLAVGTFAYTDLHDFTGSGTDGSYAYGGVSLDSSGNLYGTTYYGGSNNEGTVWQITKPQALSNP